VDRRGTAGIRRSLFRHGAPRRRPASGGSHLDHPIGRWRTILHEALHTFTPPLTRAEYRKAVGWEEGIIEQLQRLLRQRVLAIIGITIPEESFAPIERDHHYNGYIQALERVRAALGQEPEPFYRLLRTPLPQRYDLLAEAAETLPEKDRGSYRIVLRLAHAQLSREQSGP
jgi:hypothetical protein